MATPKPATSASQNETIRNHASFIWSVADLLRGDYKQIRLRQGHPAAHGDPPSRLRARAHQAGCAERERAAGQGQDRERGARPAGDRGRAVLQHEPAHVHKATRRPRLDRRLCSSSTSPGSPRRPKTSSTSSTSAFRSNGSGGRDLLYQVIGKFAELDLHPDAVSNIEMGYLYEELIRRFSELSNETAGEHFTPREVIRLMVNLLFNDDADDVLTKPWRRQDAVRPRVWYRRHAFGGRGLPARAQSEGPVGGLSGRSSTPRRTPSAART